MAAPPELSFHALTRSGLVLAGLLFVGVGLGDTMAGRSKIAQYEEIIQSTPSAEPEDPAALFPTASEGHERHTIARAKLGFYQMLFTSGQILTVLGFVLLVLGVLQLRFRSTRTSLRPPVPD